MRRSCLWIAAVLGGIALVAQAQEEPPPLGQQQDAASADEAVTLQELLDMVGEGTVRDAETFRQRMQEFRQQQSEQEALLQQAEEDKAAEEARSVMLEEQASDNERLITELEAQFADRLGSLNELFGVLQQVAGDARTTFDESLTNIEFPGRGEFLTEIAQKMGRGNVLPTIQEIEQIWFELQREATELGRVKRIPNYEFSSTTGERITEDIVRVGAFNIIADGRYLTYNAQTETVAELQRQPSQGRFVNSTSALMNAEPGDGMVSFGIDITRGVVLDMLIATPNLIERIQQGRTIGYVIIGLGILGILLALERFITLSITGSKVRSQLKSDTPKENNPLGRVLKVYEQNPNADTETLELKLSEAILRELPALQRGVLFIKIISVVAPLLGLLGTVTGMIDVFQSMALFGTGDASVMAGGISQALMTTVLGLCVAIPTVLLHTFVSGRSKRIIQTLQEQSAGIVARKSEQSH